ncbi:MAG TPA: hypothetical protein PLU58_01600 [Saprospiraceae bacterium]|jgi:hypothetical protein|nr:hypothetical protein [Saprospiraceae bacterium]
MSNTKNYIGKGKAQKFGVRVNINIGKAEKYFYEKEGERYLTFFLDEMKQPDDFGRTHTAYVLDNTADAVEQVPQAQEPVAEIKENKKRSRKK